MNSGFSDKTKQDILNAFHGKCGYKDCGEKATSVHHRKPKAKYNISRYPLYINSIFNAVPLCQHHHEYRAEWNISDDLAAVYENYLRKLIVNMPFSAIEANGVDNNGDLIHYDIK